MGNHAGKDSHCSTGSPLDFFHTPATTPSEPEVTAMASLSAASTNKAQQKDTASAETAGSSSATPFSTSPIADWTQKLSVPSEWAVISVDGMTSPEINVSSAAAKHGKAAISPISSPSSKGSPSEQSWQERDSGVEPQAEAEKDGEEMTLVLLSLMEHYRGPVHLTTDKDIIRGAVELLRDLITERDELLEEVHSLRETLKTERVEWHQFQCDLQVAVSVADRMRVESEQALGLLQESHRVVEEQLAQALGREQEQARELESLRGEHRDTCNRLSELTLQRQQEQAELDALRNVCRVKDTTDCDKEAERKDSEEGHTEKHEEGEEIHKEEEKPRNAEAEAKNLENEKQENEANQGVDAEDVGSDPEELNGEGRMQVTGKGVAEGYLRSLAAMEEKKKEEGHGQKDQRRIVMLSERSWSLSRLPLPIDTSIQNGTSQNTSTTLPLCKKEQPKGRRMDRILQRQDSWSSFYTRKQDEEQYSDSSRPQDGFSALLRRHGGSRRNSLLCWCQSRTRGYKDIEITNFSSSWEDGLAFCALYHTYLSTLIPYSSLKPADKKENLVLAFQTGESVGITATLTVEEMLKVGGPDWQRVLGYVESIFRHFEM